MRSIKVNGYTVRYYFNVPENREEWHVNHKVIGYCGWFDTLQDAKEYCNNG